MEHEPNNAVFGIITEAANINTEPDVSTGSLATDIKTSNVTHPVTVEMTDSQTESTPEEDDRRLRRQLIIEIVQRNFRNNQFRRQIGKQEDFVLYKLARELAGPVLYVTTQQPKDEA